MNKWLQTVEIASLSALFFGCGLDVAPSQSATDSMGASGNNTGGDGTNGTGGDRTNGTGGDGTNGTGGDGTNGTDVLGSPYGCDGRAATKFSVTVPGWHDNMVIFVLLPDNFPETELFAPVDARRLQSLNFRDVLFPGIYLTEAVLFRDVAADPPFTLTYSGSDPVSGTAVIALIDWYTNEILNRQHIKALFGNDCPY